MSTKVKNKPAPAEKKPKKPRERSPRSLPNPPGMLRRTLQLSLPVHKLSKDGVNVTAGEKHYALEIAVDLEGLARELGARVIDREVGAVATLSRGRVQVKKLEAP